MRNPHSCPWLAEPPQRVSSLRRSFGLFHNRDEERMVASRESESHPLQWPHTERHSPSGCPRLSTLPSRVPDVTGNDGPPPLPPAVQQRPGLRKPGCRALTPRQRRRRAGPARLLTPASRAGLLAALRGTGAPGSAPAASRGRPPPGAGPAAAALRTPPARRQRQQLQPRCPSSYFSDGSSRCCLGKRFFPPARNRFPTFHQST